MFRGDILQHLAPFSRQQCEGDARTYSYILEPDIQAIVQNTLKDDMVTKQKVHMSVCVCVCSASLQPPWPRLLRIVNGIVYVNYFLTRVRG